MTAEKYIGPYTVPNNGASGLADSMIPGFSTAIQLAGTRNEVKNGD